MIELPKEQTSTRTAIIDDVDDFATRIAIQMTLKQKFAYSRGVYVGAAISFIVCIVIYLITILWKL